MELDKSILYAPIAKSDTEQRMVWGYVSSEDLDADHQIADTGWLKNALSEWFENWHNIREMHRAKAVGRATELKWVGIDGERPMIGAKIVDQDAWKMVKEGIYNGFSIGIKNIKIQPDPVARNGRIIGGEIIEVSLVDRPANPTAKFTMYKAAALESDILSRWSWMMGTADIEKAVLPDMEKREFEEPGHYTESDRKKIPPEDFADPEHEKYPIVTGADVNDAWRLAGRSQDVPPNTIRRRIIEIARRKELEGYLPETAKNWMKEHGMEAKAAMDEKEREEREREERERKEHEEAQKREAEEKARKMAEEKAKAEQEEAEKNKAAVREQFAKALKMAEDIGDPMVLKDIQKQIKALARQTDKDRDGDIDFPADMKAALVEEIKGAVVNALKDEVETAVKTLLPDVEKAVMPDNIKGLIEAMDQRVARIEQLAPEKGGIMEIVEVTKKFAVNDKGSGNKSATVDMAEFNGMSPEQALAHLQNKFAGADEQERTRITAGVIEKYVYGQ